MKEKIELGDRVQCKITGLKGIVTSLTTHLTGCDRAGVQLPPTADGKPSDSYWVDMAALKVIEKGAVKLEEVQEQGPGAKKGGPADKIPPQFGSRQ